MNKPGSSATSTRVGLQLGLRPPSYPLSLFAMLNDYVPSWSDLIPRVLSHRAKELSLYIYLDGVCRNLHMVFEEEPARAVLLTVSLRGYACCVKGKSPASILSHCPVLTEINSSQLENHHTCSFFSSSEYYILTPNVRVSSKLAWNNRRHG